MLRDYVKPGSKVLDFGCGLGFFSIAMAKMVGEGGLVIAADLQDVMLQGLMKRARRAGVCSFWSPGLTRPRRSSASCSPRRRPPGSVRSPGLAPSGTVLSFWSGHRLGREAGSRRDAGPSFSACPAYEQPEPFGPGSDILDRALQCPRSTRAARAATSVFGPAISASARSHRSAQCRPHVFSGRRSIACSCRGSRVRSPDLRT